MIYIYTIIYNNNYINKATISNFVIATIENFYKFF